MRSRLPAVAGMDLAPWVSDALARSNVREWAGADGTWARVPDRNDGSSVNAQRELYQRALDRAHRT